MPASLGQRSRLLLCALSCASLIGISGCKDSSRPAVNRDFSAPEPTGQQTATTPSIPAAGVASANQAGAPTFLPVSLDAFYQKQFVDYRPSASWAQVPRGETQFDGVPFLLTGKIDLAGLGRARDGEFHPSRVGEIPVGQKAVHLHLIHGASYDAPDDTPIASLRLRYENGETRNLFVRYGVHARNWYIEKRETNPELSDARSLVIWNGHSGPDGTGTPTRLFKTTFDNPLPSQAIRSLELLSLFARANSVMLAITLEQTPGSPAPAESGWDEDDTDYRREATVRALNADTGQPIADAQLKVSVTERERTYSFGDYRSATSGQIRFSYPPGRFASLMLHLSAPNYSAERVTVESEDGLFELEQIIRLLPHQEK